MKYLALIICFTALTACNWEGTDTPPDKNTSMITNAATGEMCGGIAGIICASSADYCKTDMGQCGLADGAGVCSVMPTGPCPAVFTPVCGCDGETYSNACEAEKAGVNISQLGVCPG